MAARPVHVWEVDYVLRGYHVYKDRWEPFIGEVLNCERELTNAHDLYSVAAVHQSKGTVGHLPRTISKVCSSFINRGGSIQVEVTARRQRSDLPQGGLDVPCTITFTGEKTLVTKCKKVVCRTIYQ